MISVIMLTYNRETLVSRDKSGAIVDAYAARDGRIRVVHRDRGSLGAGRNTGLSVARGDYIATIDDDDWAEPDFLEFLLNLLERNHADISICGAADKVFDEIKIMTAEESLIELMWRKRYNAAFSTKLIRRELLEGERFPEDSTFEDIAVSYRLLAKAKRVAYHGLPKYTFYRHEGNNSAWTTDHRLLTSGILDEYLRVYRTRTVWLSERFPANAATWRYFEWSFMISMVEKIVRLNIPGCTEQLEAMRNELRTHREEFLTAPETLEFEKEWIVRFI